MRFAVFCDVISQNAFCDCFAVFLFCGVLRCFADVLCFVKGVLCNTVNFFALGKLPQY